MSQAISLGYLPALWLPMHLNPVPVLNCHRFSPSDSCCQKWRRRGSNPRPAMFPKERLRV